MKERKNLASRWKNFKKNPDKVTETKTETWSSEDFTLVFHTANFSTSDLILKIGVFNGIADKEIIEICPLNSAYPSFLVQVSADSFTNKANITLSISSQMASALGVSSQRSLEVRVKRLVSENYNCEELVVSIKDQHICRSEMWRCCEEYRGMAVYKGQLISKGGSRASVSALVADGKNLLTAVITKSTKITFRTKSCKMIWMLEMSAEMWEYSPSGILYWEKMMNFLTTAFERQLLKKVNHDLTIVFFTKLCSEKQELNVYKEVIRIPDLRNAWMDALKILKKEIMFFPSFMNWNLNLPSAGKAFQELFPISKYANDEFELKNLHSSLTYFKSEPIFLNSDCWVSVSSEINLLASINYSLKRFDEQDIKSLTGHKIVIISAGTGLYNTSSAIAKVTKLRVLSQGITCTILSMKRPPLYPSPLFIYNKELFEQDFLMKSQDKPSDALYISKQKTSLYWLEIHFFYSFMQLEGTCNLQSAIHTQIHERPKKFHPLFRLSGLPRIRIPHIHTSLKLENDPTNIPKTLSDMKFQLFKHDKEIFLKNNTIKEEKSFVAYRKGTDRDTSQSPYRKDTFDPTRRESFDIETDKSSLLFTQPIIHHQTKKTCSSLKKRWSECYKVIKDQCEEILKDDHKLNDKKILEYYESVWSILLEPCLLPLVNEFWPLQKDLGEIQPFHVFVPPSKSRDQAIKDIIDSKLNIGFQIVKKNAVDSFGKSITAPDIALSLGAAYHIIIPDSNDDANLNYMVNCPKANSLQASADIFVFNIETLKYELNNYTFNFNYPATL